MLATAGLAVAGTLGFVASPVSRAQGGTRADAAGRAGWAGALSRPGMRTLALSLAGVGAAIGIWEIGLVGAAREAGLGRGGLPDAGRLGRGQRRRRPLVREPDLAPVPGRRYLALLALLVLASAPMAATGSLLALGAVVALVGLVLAPLESSAYVLAAELAPPGTLTESGTWMTTAINVTGAAGLAVAGSLVDRAGVRPPWPSPAPAPPRACWSPWPAASIWARPPTGAATCPAPATTRQLRRERRIL